MMFAEIGVYMCARVCVWYSAAALLMNQFGSIRGLTHNRFRNFETSKRHGHCNKRSFGLDFMMFGHGFAFAAEMSGTSMYFCQHGCGRFGCGLGEATLELCGGEVVLPTVDPIAQELTCGPQSTCSK